jgi:hypothetical protein
MFRSEVISEGLICLCKENLINIEWCELGCQMLRKVTITLAMQHTLMDQLDKIFIKGD